MFIVFGIFGAFIFLAGCGKTLPPVTDDLSPNETQLGYIQKFGEDAGRKYIGFDVVEWLSSSEGTCTDMHADDCPNTGVVCPGATLPNCNPNGFLIVNEDATIKNILVSENVSIQKIDLSKGTAPLPVTFNELQGFSASESYFNIIPFDIEIKNGEVVKIVERYIP